MSDCDPMDCSTWVFPVLYHLPEFAQTHVHWVSDAIQPSHPLSPTSPLALNLIVHTKPEKSLLLLQLKNRTGIRQQLLLGLFPWWYSNLRPLDLIISTAGKILLCPNPREREHFSPKPRADPLSNVSVSPFMILFVLQERGRGKGISQLEADLGLSYSPSPGLVILH